ncbi:MAG: DNA mismatch repair protein MutS [Flavobacteriaceae bacterium]|nr:DNA mismatch repair protein MutS [Flavobacteriaceae bacterium]
MDFKINDTVSAIDEDINGIVISIENDMITIETDEGFPMRFQRQKLVKVARGEFHFNGIQQAMSQKENFKKQHKRSVKPKERDEAVLVIDLHIEKLVKSKHGMSNYEILTKQLDVAKYHVELAIKQRQSKLVLIHGVGDGVLKADLYSMLRRYDRIKFYDASYVKYGQGATEVYIYQNVSR